MIWLICGGRDFIDIDLFNRTMTRLIDQRGMPKQIVHGAAKGADSMAHAWARQNGITVFAVAADWDKDGRSAGPIRNQKMLDEYMIDLVIAFPGGRGTADMIKRARSLKILVETTWGK